MWLSGKGYACKAGDSSVIPGSNRSLEKEMATTPVLLPGKSMDRGAWQVIVHGGLKRIGRDLVTKQQ